MFLASENIDFTGLAHVFLLGGGERYPPFCRWPEGMALCRYAPGRGSECNHLLADGNGKSQQPTAGRLSASSAQYNA